MGSVLAIGLSKAFSNERSRFARILVLLSKIGVVMKTYVHMLSRQLWEC